MLPLADVKAWLKVTSDEFDADIQALVDRASAFIERETDWYFGEPRAKQEILDGTGTPALYLKQPPVNGVVVDERPAATDAWEVLSSQDYEADGRGLSVATRWLRGRRNFRVTYQEGFTEVPGDVAQLLLDLVQMKWKERGERTEMQSETIGDYSYTRADLDGLTSWSTVKSNWKRLRVY